MSYREGDWFAIPLRERGFGLGVVVRANPNGVLVGYFFGPSVVKLPSLRDVTELNPGDAVLVTKFGHLGVARGKWPVLGRLDIWDRSRWPMPVFIRYEELTGRSFNVFYDESDPSRVLREEEVSPGVAEQGPKDGLMGAGFVEKVLTDLLS